MPDLRVGGIEGITVNRKNLAFFDRDPANDAKPVSPVPPDT
jgi:hypothetical protein